MVMYILIFNFREETGR